MNKIIELPKSNQIINQTQLTSIAKALKLHHAGLGQGLILLSLMSSGAVFASPQGGVIVGGNGAISNAGKTTNINQNTDKLAIDWDSFNLKADETVKFLQPSSSSLVLNRVLDENPSTIYGSIDANGHVLLVNPRGILFTETARINVNSMTASSLDIDTNKFMNNDFAFKDTDGAGYVINKGVINAASGVVLQGEHVANTGLIAADMVTLAGGSETVLTFDSDQLIGVLVTKEILEAQGVDSAVLNSGTIEAGEIILTAQTAKGLFDTAVNNEGILEAKGINTSGGTIRLGGFGGDVADVVNTGTIDVSASGTNAAGGRVQIEGDTIQVKENSKIIATGDNGGGTVLIGGDYQGKNPDIHNAKNVVVEAGSKIDASALVNGDGGKVIVWSDDTAVFAGKIKARGGVNAGDGGFVETSGKKHLTATGRVNAGASNGKAGTWLLDPENINIKSGDNSDGITGDVVHDQALEQALLDDTNVVLTATKDNAQSTGATGNITVNAVIDPAIANGGQVSLTLNADHDIKFNDGSGINSANYGDFNITLNADNTVYIHDGVTLNTHGGSFTSESVNFINRGIIELIGDSGSDNNGIATISIGKNNQNGTGFLGAINNAASKNISAIGSGYNTFAFQGGAISFEPDGTVAIDNVKLANAGAVAYGTVTYDGTVTYNGTTAGALSGSATNDDTFTLGTDNNQRDYIGYQSVNFIGLGTVDAGGGSNTITGLSNSDEYELTGSNHQVKAQGSTFSGIHTVSADGSSNTLTGTTGNDGFHLSSADNAVSSNSIDFTGITTVDGNGGTDNLSGSDGDDTFNLQADPNKLISKLISFEKIATVDGGSGNGTDTVNGVTDSNNAFALTGSANQVTSKDITFSAIETVNGSTATNTLSGSGSDDSFKLTETANQVKANSITFNSISGTIDAGDGNDKLTGSGGSDNFALTGNVKEVDAGGFTFAKIEVVDAEGDTADKVTGTSASDNFALNGNPNEVVSQSITFKQIRNVDAGGNPDNLVTGTGGIDTYHLTGNANELITQGITFSKIAEVVDASTNNILMGSISSDTFALQSGASIKGNDVLFNNIGNSIDGISTDNILIGTINADNFTLKAAPKQIFIDNKTFTGITEVQGGGGTDSITGSGDADEFELTADNNKIISKLITFSDIQIVSGGGTDSTNNVVKGLDSTVDHDSYLLTGQNRELISKGITFSNIDTVNSQQGTDTLTGSESDDSFQLTATPDQIKANGIFFNNTATDINAGGGTDTLTGTISDDQFKLTTIAKQLIAGNFTISDLETVDGASSTTGNTVKGTSADDQYVLTENAGEFITRGMTFTHVSEVLENEQNNTLTGSTTHDTFQVTNSTATQKDVMGNGVLFNGITGTVNGNGGNDTLVGTSGNDKFYLKTADNSVQSEGMIFTGISTVNGAYGHGDDSIIGTDGDEEFALQSVNNVIKTKEIVFSNIASVEGNGGSDSIKGFDTDDNYLVTAQNALTAKGVNFLEITTIGGTAGTLTNNTGFTKTVEIDGALKLLGMTFNDVDQYVGDSAFDSVLDSDGGNWNTGSSQNEASKGAYSFSNINSVTTSGTARLSSSVAVDPGTENDAQIVTADSDGLQLKGISFLGALGFDGVADRGDEIHDITGFKWAITGNRASTRKADLGDQTFTDISKITTTGEIDDETNSAWTVDGQKLATSTVNNLTVSNTSKVTTTGQISNTSDAHQDVTLGEDSDTSTIALAGITFHGSQSYLGSTTNDVNDNVSDSLGRTWGITGSQALTSVTVTLSNIDKLSGVTTVTNDTGAGLDVAIGSDSTLTSANILLANTTNYTGHGDDTINDARTSGDWTLNLDDSLVSNTLTFNKVKTVNSSGALTDAQNSDWLVTENGSANNTELFFNGTSSITSTGHLTNGSNSEETVTVASATDMELLGITFSGASAYIGHGADNVNDTQTGSGWNLTGTRAVSNAGRSFSGINAVATDGDINDTTDSDWATGTNHVATAADVTFTGTSRVVTTGNLSSDAAANQQVEAKANGLKLAEIDFAGATVFTGNASRNDTVSDASGNNWNITGNQAAGRVINNTTTQTFSAVTEIATAGAVTDNTNSDWSVDGVKLASSEARDMSVRNSSLIKTTGDVSNATGVTQDVTVDLDTNGASTIALAEMTFEGSQTYNGSTAAGANDTITDDEGRTWGITDARTVTSGSVTLNNIGQLAGVTDITNATTSGVDITITSSGTLTGADVVFTDADTYSGHNTEDDTVIDQRTGEGWSLDQNGSVTSDGLTFNAVDIINSDGAVTNATDNTLSVTLDSDRLSLANIDFVGTTEYFGDETAVDTVTGTGATWALDSDNNEVSSTQSSGYAVTFHDVDAVNETGGSLQGTAEDDTFTIDSDADSIDTKGMLFTGITTLDAGEPNPTEHDPATDGDILIGTSEEWTLEVGNKTVSVGKLTASNIEQVADQGNGSIVGTNNNDEFDLTGANALWANNIFFSGIGDISGAQGKDIVSSENSTWYLQSGDNTIKTNGILVTDINSITDKGEGKIVGTSGSDTFRITGEKTLTAQDINFAGISMIDGNGGNDVAEAGDNIAVHWQLQSGNNEFSAAAMDFSGISSIIGNGYYVDDNDKEELIATATNDEFKIIGDKSLEARNMSINGIRFIYSGDGVDEIIGNNANWELNGEDNSFITSGMTFFETEKVTEQSGTGLLTGSNQADSISWKGNKTLESNGVEFTGFDSINTGAGKDTVYIDGLVNTLASLSGGDGDEDTLINNTPNLGWELTDTFSSLGGKHFTNFENLSHTLSTISLVSNSSIELAQNSISTPDAINKSIDTSAVTRFERMTLQTDGTITGLANTDEIDAKANGNVAIQTNNTIKIDDIISKTGNVSVTANQGDIVVNGLIAAQGSGNVALNSKTGNLLADGSNTHIQARNVNLKAAQAVGTQQLPFTINTQPGGTVTIESNTYVKPLFTDVQGLLLTTGERLLSFSEAVALSGLRSASQQLVNQLGSVDPAIFTAISSFSVAENSTGEPQTGDFMVAQNDGGYSIQSLPIEATAAGEEGASVDECTSEEKINSQEDGNFKEECTTEENIF